MRTSLRARQAAIIAALLLPGLAVVSLVGCGEDSARRLAKEEAEGLVGRESGAKVVSCGAIDDVEVGNPPLGKDRQVWRCVLGQVNEECWETGFAKDGTPFALGPDVSHAVEGIAICPEFEAAPPPPPEDLPYVNTDPYGPEGDLAKIELGYRASADNGILKVIGEMLSEMKEDCPGNTRRELADFTANALLLLEDGGVKAAPTEILADVSSASVGAGYTTCRDLFVTYVITRTDGG